MRLGLVLAGFPKGLADDGDGGGGNSQFLEWACKSFSKQQRSQCGAAGAAGIKSVFRGWPEFEALALRLIQNCRQESCRGCDEGKNATALAVRNRDD
jgi:hypothetical protein